MLPRALEPLAADLARAAVIVDFDGTISPIIVNPSAARPLPRAVGALARLVNGAYRVTVISARPVGFLREAVPVTGLRYVGQYGAERLVGDAPMIDERMIPYVAPLQTVAEKAEAELPGILVERKGLGVTLHWRSDPGREAEAVTVGCRLADEYGFETARGRMALELRPPVAIDKGDAVTVETEGATAIVCVGDDRSDLAMFDALDRLTAGGIVAHAVRVAVRSPEGPGELVARADIVLDGTDAVAQMLEQLADSAGV